MVNGHWSKEGCSCWGNPIWAHFWHLVSFHNVKAFLSFPIPRRQLMWVSPISISISISTYDPPTYIRLLLLTFFLFTLLSNILISKYEWDFKFYLKTVFDKYNFGLNFKSSSLKIILKLIVKIIFLLLNCIYWICFIHWILKN